MIDFSHLHQNPCLHLIAFGEAEERINDQLQKADYQFYGCAFAPGGNNFFGAFTVFTNSTANLSWPLQYPPPLKCRAEYRAIQRCFFN
jgi:hypothetical protein